MTDGPLFPLYKQHMKIPIRQQKYLPEEFPPPWASEWGEDGYGIWIAFRFKSVRQVFRWCEPGIFVMGSPGDEPARDDDESQHEVRLTEGFWLADTCVTQQLYQAVVGNNPSDFKGDELPVESVSWEDAQECIDRLNGMQVGLELCLPTEAQWEYGCRAGTDTPFSWGEQIDSTLVNFNGNSPYAGGKKCEYRKQTVPVQELPCNGWGLYQMHGNVWEWCADWYGEYPAEPVVDPVGSLQGNFRVLRGGSWFDDGGSCRSAYRGGGEPSSRDGVIGFRLSRGHSTARSGR